MGLIPKSKWFRILAALGTVLLCVVLAEVFWLAANRHKIWKGRPFLKGFISEVDRSYVDVTGDGALDEVRLDIEGDSWSRPLKWTLTVVSGTKVIYERSGDDAYLDKFFNDKGYVNEECNGYLECKRQYYQKDMPAHIMVNWPGNTGQDRAWIARARLAAKEELRSKFKLTPGEAEKTAGWMFRRLESGGVQVLYVPVSPVQSEAPRMYVPRVGGFVTISDEM